jgi:hypothetical protein
MVDRSDPSHEIKELVIATKKNVQPHFHMISICIYPTPDFTPHKRAGFIKLYLVSGIYQVYRSGHTR